MKRYHVSDGIYRTQWTAASSNWAYIPMLKLNRVS